jgi:large subunit ribosomal protein L15
MRLDDLRPAKGATKARKRVGRGPGSGHGKTATKGHKGQGARSGGKKAGGFEGGQMPLYRRLPKRGFTARNHVEYAVVNLKALAGFSANAVVDPDGLVTAGVIKKSDRDRVKVLGDGDVTHALTVKAHAVSGAARAKIEAAGGRVELLGAPAAEATKSEAGRAAGRTGAGAPAPEATNSEAGRAAGRTGAGAPAAEATNSE